MKTIEFKNFEIRIEGSVRSWALPICVSFGKKLVVIRILCLEIEIDCINETDIENEEVQDNINV